MSENSQQTTEQPTREKDGGPYKGSSEELACPNCGIVQRVQWMRQDFKDARTTVYVDRECPICGFNDVWY